MGGARAVESEVDESDEEDMYVDESSEDEEDDDEEDDDAHGTGASRHRLEWDNDIWSGFWDGGNFCRRIDFLFLDTPPMTVYISPAED